MFNVGMKIYTMFMRENGANEGYLRHQMMLWSSVRSYDNCQLGMYLESFDLYKPITM